MANPPITLELTIAVVARRWAGYFRTATYSNKTSGANLRYARATWHSRDESERGGAEFNGQCRLVG